MSYNPTATMGCVTVAYLFRIVRGGCKNIGQCENPTFYRDFLTYSLKTKGPTFQEGGGRCDVGHEAQCGLQGAARVAGRKAQGATLNASEA
jgi:hypothetical protein